MAPQPDLATALSRALPAGYALRDRTDDDLPALRDLYAQTREEELRAVAWPPEAKRAFLDDQFAKQHAHYLQHYRLAHWWVITAGGVPVGRLYVEQTASDLRIMEVTLDRAHRNRGVGGALMRVLVDHAQSSGVRCSLHVEPFNPAYRLYQRLGFVTREERGVYCFMTREPAVS